MTGSAYPSGRRATCRRITIQSPPRAMPTVGAERLGRTKARREGVDGVLISIVVLGGAGS